MDNVVFIVTSTINSHYGNNETRFLHTLDTFTSVRKHFPTAIIVFADNSIVPIIDRHKNKLQDSADYCLFLKPDLATRLFNRNAIQLKGSGEAMIMDAALEFIVNNNLVGSRIFKITGRYRLMDEFNADLYSQPEVKGKYVVKKFMTEIGRYPNDENMRYYLSYVSAFWSMCGTLVNEYRELHLNIFERLWNQSSETMEAALYDILPQDKVFEIESFIFIQGLAANTGSVSFY